jgi:hypothetical protein
MVVVVAPEMISECGAKESRSSWPMKNRASTANKNFTKIWVTDMCLDTLM